MSKKATGTTVDSARRNFLKTAGLAGGTAALAIAGDANAGDRAVEDDRKQSEGYRETEHVRAYYQSARI